MIREGKRLPADVLDKIPASVEKISRDRDVIALYTFGSLAELKLKPLSDLDFGILLSKDLNRQERFKKSIDLIGVFNETLKTDEVDLSILNDDPIRFVYQILKTGKLLYCRDRKNLIDFCEEITKLHIDFQPVIDQFNKAFLEGVGYHG